MSLVEYAQSEMELAHVEEDVRPSLLAAIEAYASYGHSGGSHSVCVEILYNLLNFKPLGPLTGDDAEWVHVADNLWQNKRRSTVFKDRERAWDIDLPTMPDDRWQTITFPYTVRD